MQNVVRAFKAVRLIFNMMAFSQKKMSTFNMGHMTSTPLRFNFIKKKSSRQVAENSIQDIGALELYSMQKKSFLKMSSFSRFMGLRKSHFLKIAKFSHF